MYLKNSVLNKFPRSVFSCKNIFINLSLNSLNCIARSGKAFYATDGKITRKIYKAQNPYNTNYNACFKTPLVLSKKISKNHKKMQSFNFSKQKTLQQKVGIRTATIRLKYFSLRGNLPRREKYFGSYREDRSLNYKKSKKIPLGVYLSKFFYAATPFIRLKTRRRQRSRRKKVSQKVTFRTRTAGERQAYLLFSKTLQKKKQSSQKGIFRDQIQTQRETLFAANRNRFSKKNLRKKSPNGRNGFLFAQQPSTNLSTTSGTKTLRDTRDDLHKRAYQIKPRYWRYRGRRLYIRKPKKTIFFWKQSLFLKKFQNFFGDKSIKIKSRVSPKSKFSFTVNSRKKKKSERAKKVK